MTSPDQQPSDDPARRNAGNGPFLVAMVLIGVAMLLGPITVITHSQVVLNSAVALGLIGVGVAIFAAIRSFLA